MQNKAASYTVGLKVADTLFGSLELARDRTGNTVALKISDRRLMRSRVCKIGKRVPEDPMMEVRVLQIFKDAGGHQNIITMHDHFKNGNSYWQVLEFAAGGEFFDYLEREDQLSVPTARHFFRQAAEAVNFMHAQRVVHMDLSLENMLLTGGQKTLKICDFGLSQILSEEESKGDSRRLLRSVGKVSYMAPEVYDPHLQLPQCYDVRSVDVYSLGVCLFMMVTGYPPAELPTFEDPRFALLAEEGLPLLVQHYQRNFGLDQLDADLVDLLDHMICLPERRYTMEQVLAHPFLQQRPSTHTDGHIVKTTLQRSITDPRELSGSVQNVIVNNSLSSLSASLPSLDTPRARRTSSPLRSLIDSVSCCTFFTGTVKDECSFEPTDKATATTVTKSALVECGSSCEDQELDEFLCRLSLSDLDTDISCSSDSDSFSESRMRDIRLSETGAETEDDEC